MFPPSISPICMFISGCEDLDLFFTCRWHTQSRGVNQPIKNKFSNPPHEAYTCNSTQDSSWLCAICRYARTLRADRICFSHAMQSFPCNAKQICWLFETIIFRVIFLPFGVCSVLCSIRVSVSTTTFCNMHSTVSLTCFCKCISEV